MNVLPAIAPSFVAGFLYIFSPGPIFISMLSLVSHTGRKEGFKLASGAFLGDLIWLLFTYAFLIGANEIPQLFSIVLNASCGTYLFYLAYKMFKNLHRKSKVIAFQNSFYDGLVLGLLNPKSYPVAISLFSSLLYSQRESLTIKGLPFLMLAAALGMVVAYIAEILLAGLGNFRLFYNRYCKAFTIVFAVIFMLFGIKLWFGIIS